MNILVIGNGFDLAHGLPAKYGDFLEFCERIRVLYSYDELGSHNEYNPSKKAEYICAYKQEYFDNWKTNECIKMRVLDFF